MAGVTFILCFCLLKLVSAYHGNVDCQSGRTGMVNFFMWKWKDVANECEFFLGPNNFCAVQVSPSNEHQLLLVNLQQPWYQRWRPVSYKVETRSGLENEFQTMVQTCNVAGVRVYADIVMNHMTDAILDGYGSAGSYYQGQSQDYPGVPYSNNDFHKQLTLANPAGQCPSENGEVINSNDKQEVRYCRKDNLNDLMTSQSKVRETFLEYIDKLLGFGVAGFRLDAAKYIEPADIEYVVNNTRDLDPGWFPGNKRPFVYSDVIDFTSNQTWTSEYTGIGRVSEYRYGSQLGDYFRKNDNKTLAGLKNFGSNLIEANSTVVFVDNQVSQRGLYGIGFKSVLSFHESKLYQMANAFMLAWPFGFTQIMSSYDWPRDISGDQDNNEYYGPPANFSSNSTDNILDVIVNSDERSCGNGWKCEHRWRTIQHMLDFRNRVDGTAVINWWDNGANQIAFGRKAKGFIVINNSASNMGPRLATGLPAGVYCDLISSENVGPSCDGKQITVDAGGFADFVINTSDEIPVIAITV